MNKDELTWCAQSIMMIAARAGLMSKGNLNELQAMLNDIDYGDDLNDANFFSGIVELLEVYKQDNPI